MGFPLRANIFRAGSPPQRYIRRFPIQVAVLFSPNDDAFAPAFRELFLELDRLTGDRVAFFAVLDPPADWQEVARTRSWWQEHQAQVGKLGFSYDDLTLVNEIARRFGVEFWQMPVIVVSPNLWTAEYITARTSAQQIVGQLTALTDLAREWEAPNIDQIIDLFEQGLGTAVRYSPPSFPNQNSLDSYYDVLGNYDPDRNRLIDHGKFNQELYEIGDLVQGNDSPLANTRSGDRGSQDQDDNRLFDLASEEIAGRIIPVATVAGRVLGWLSDNRYSNVIGPLDEASLAMVESSLDAGRLLEEMERGNLPGQRPRRIGDRPRDLSGVPTDFTPGANGIWKMLERETNMSLIQAGRQAYGIRMPDYFILHDPQFPRNGAKVRTKRREVNLNQLDHQRKPRHRFLTLGGGWHVVDTLQRQPDPDFSGGISTILGRPLPDGVMRTWDEVYGIRNKASHIEPLSYDDYQRVLEKCLRFEFLDPLMHIKRALMSGKTTI